MEYIKKEFQKDFGEIPVVKIWKQNGQSNTFTLLVLFTKNWVVFLQWYLGIGIYIRVDRTMKSGSLVISMSTHHLSFVSVAVQGQDRHFKTAQIKCTFRV